MKLIFTFFVIHILLLNNVFLSTNELEKYGTIDALDSFIFHSESFQDDETMLFKIECPYLFTLDYVEYYYLDTI